MFHLSRPPWKEPGLSRPSWKEPGYIQALLDISRPSWIFPGPPGYFQALLALLDISRPHWSPEPEFFARNQEAFINRAIHPPPRRVEATICRQKELTSQKWCTFASSPVPSSSSLAWRLSALKLIANGKPVPPPTWSAFVHALVSVPEFVLSSFEICKPESDSCESHLDTGTTYPGPPGYIQAISRPPWNRWVQPIVDASG